ncbi:MAG TPA: ABC transporter substrate-binding protein [Microthrixaceae bacterium]|nr:ABC transporter substrate-binding protein [Microthrixaceae bacterium]
MQTARWKGLAVFVAATAMLAGACSSSDGADNSADSTPKSGNRGNVNDELVLGTLVPQSGDLNVIVKSLATPINMAVEEINAAGGVLGKDVKVVQGDDGTSPDVAKTTYNKLINSDKVDAIIGPAPSGVAAKLADTFETDKVPACSGSTTAGNLTGVGGGYFFRTAPPDKLQGPALADLITGDNHGNVAIIARNDDYGKGFADFLSKALTGSGAAVAATVLYDPDGSNFDADVQKVADAKPDAVAVIGFNDDGAKVINAMIAKGIGPSAMPIYTADGMKSSSFAKTVDPSDLSKVAGIKGTAPAAAPAGIESPFLAKFAQTGIDTIFSSYFYDCTILMALAAQSAGSDSGEAIAKAFSTNLEGDNVCNTYAQCLGFLKEKKTIHYHGASSEFQKWDGMEPGTGVYDVWEYTKTGEDKTLDVPQINVS